MAKTERKHRGSSCLLTLILLALLALAVWLLWPSSPVPDRSGETLLCTDDSFNMLLVGSDQNDEFGVNGRADSIMLVHVDLADDELFFLSIPRDTLVDIPGYGQDKINHSFAYGGIDLLRQSVEGLLGVPVDYYAATDFNGFAKIVDALGGVEIDVDKRMYYQTYDGLIDIEAGPQILNGEQALQYVRFRQDELGDITRVSRQQTFLKALVEKCASPSMIPKLPQVISAVGECIETDLPTRYIVRLSFRYMNALSNLNSTTLPGWFADINGVSYWAPDQEAINTLINEEFLQ